jgi:hypothetical protein
MIESNRLDAQFYTAENRARVLNNKTQESISRREYVQASRERIEQERIAAIELRLAKKDQRNGMKKLDRADEKLNKYQQMQARWFAATALASRLALVKAFLEERHRMRIGFLLYTRSALVIQRRWKYYKQLERLGMEEKSYAIIRRKV